ncbi:MAG: TIM barrel protein [Bryobacteraceae bacterium]
MNRRDFLLASLAAPIAAKAAPRKLNVSIFSKHLQFLQGEALAKAVAEIGFDGIDLAVRPGGHVEPERVAQDLPPLLKIIRAHQLEVPMITSGIEDADTPHAESVLRTISELGIHHYRWGGFKYDPAGPAFGKQLEALKPRVAKLAALNARYKTGAMFHTHSGINLVGAPIWDLYVLLKDFDPQAVGVNYDVGHATVEGGFGGWIDSFRVLGPHLRGVAVKDFLWEKDARGIWKAEWKPIGEGMVRFPQFFQLLAQSDFTGPLQVHFEYPLGGADAGKRTITMPREQVLSAMKRDLEKVRAYLGKAGLG